MKDFRPLDEEEQKIIQQAQRIMGNSSTVPCTACRYCTEGCPMQISIPDVFKAMNLQLGTGQMEDAKKAYVIAAPVGHMASDCIGCGQCEGVCPQHLPIIDLLKEASGLLDT